jgi:hypothetical protein
LALRNLRCSLGAVRIFAAPEPKNFFKTPYGRSGKEKKERGKAPPFTGQKLHHDVLKKLLLSCDTFSNSHAFIINNLA